uniref:Uncharacterized protein n=1 Tax=Amblyomma americanum TaxID=6943 RepID=A0A0C9R4M9_AMBAM
MDAASCKALRASCRGFCYLFICDMLLLLLYFVLACCGCTLHNALLCGPSSSALPCPRLHLLYCMHFLNCQFLFILLYCVVRGGMRLCRSKKSYCSLQAPLIDLSCCNRCEKKKAPITVF